MTKNCIKTVLKLQEDSEVFCDLTHEQLLWSVVVDAGYKDTLYLLETTDWSKWCPRLKKIVEEKRYIYDE